MESSVARMTQRVLIGLLIVAATQGIAGAVMQTSTKAHHALNVRLNPADAQLEGHDRILLQQLNNGPLQLRISPRARIHAVQIDGRDHPHTFDRGRLSLPWDQNRPTRTLELTIHYTCRFDDPAPVRPMNTDNPGFGVKGTISPSGTFILHGAGWYPRVVDAGETFDLRVDGPAGTVAVTTGHLEGIDHAGDRTVSHWRIDNPLEGLSLSAGPYVIDRQVQDDISVATYLFPPSRHLSTRYLEASLIHLKRYSDLFGAYPFDDFAVVENFFPTGYGFPAYTLMGSRVLSLPFIPQTSLPHEIVHNWWGNGVLVDAASGNWCEGLAAYTADYLMKERVSPQAAMAYRRQALRNYSSLVSPTDDFPLSRFSGRTDPVTKAVGYDKAAMVFHMLRRRVGDDIFWQALRDLYDQFLFKRAAWQDLQTVFELRADRSMNDFFRQWISRPGAPRLRLEGVRTARQASGYRTTGRLVQEKPGYDLTLELALATEDGPIRKTVHLPGRQTQFEIISRGRPHTLMADPDHHLFRRLSLEEMPPSVNTLKGSPSVVLVVASRMGPDGRLTARQFVRAMGLKPIRIVDEADFSDTDADGKDLLFIGLPQRPEAVRLLPGAPVVASTQFRLAGRRFDQPGDLLFFVARHPDHPQRIISLLHRLSPDASDAAIFKIPHYGRYSYLAFRDGHNQSKGTWMVEASPMMFRWEAADRP